MNPKRLIASFCLSLTTLSSHLVAANLVDVYRDAVNSDPTFKEAQADWMANKVNLSIARSAFLPSINLSGNWERRYHKTSFHSNPTKPGETSGYYSNSAYGLSLQQPIFNFQAWQALSQTSASVKAAGATFNSAIQDLIFRTTQAYCNVLIAQAKLRFTIAEKRAYLTQLNTAREKYKVGLIAITPLYNAQASYDSATAQEIIDRNELSNQREALRAITGKLYPSLNGLGAQVPLIRPTPNDINAWVDRAEKQNFALQAQHYETIAARDNIKVQSSARLPTLNMTGNYAYNQATNGPASIRALDHTNDASVGLSLNFPIFQGGMVFANTKQARYQYAGASAQLELQHRNVVNNTRTAFLGVISGISQIKANAQAIRSQEKAVETTVASYNVGTRTMVDVLEAYSTLYNSQASHAQAQYNYIIQSLSLKEEAGTLSLNDIKVVNQWLTKNVSFMRNKNDNTPSSGLIKTNSQQNKIKQHPNTSHKKQMNQTKFYTIQIYAAHSKKAAQRFINKNKATPSLRMAQIQKHKQNFFKVIYGKYESTQMAQKDLYHLKQQFKEAWVTRLPQNAVVADAQLKAM